MDVSIELWTDGSGTRDAPGGWAWLLRAVTPDGEIAREVEGCGGDFYTTSQRMEITAVLEGLRQLKAPAIVTLYTDSKYVADMLAPHRLAIAQASGWARSSAAGGGRLKNVDLWETILAVLKSGIQVHARHVKGHSGIEANDLVDQAAGEQRRAFIDAMGEQLTLVDQEAAVPVELAGPESAVTGG